MKWIALFLLLGLPLYTCGQGWSGYNTSMYAGIHGLSYQPEIHSVMPSDWDINVISTNFTFFNESLFGFNTIDEIKKGNIHSVDDIFQSRTGVIRSETKLPSFAVKLNEKSTIGFSWDVRGVLFSRLSSKSIGEFIDELDQGSDQVTFQSEFSRGILSAWTEIGFFYSRELYNRGGNRLFGGLNLKLLSGAGELYMDLSNVSFSYRDNVLSDVNLSIKMRMTEEVSDFIVKNDFPLFKTFGYGTDLGFNYERTKQNNLEDGYQFKIGFSLKGLGKLNYKNTTELNSLSVQADQISRESFTGIETVDELRDTLASVFDIQIDEKSNVLTRIPLDINLYGDFHLLKKWYIHMGFNRILNYFGNERYDDLSYTNYYIVPRYESRKIGLYIPFSYNEHVSFQSGIAFRWKPLVIGSGNVFSYFIKGESNTNLDLYFTTRIMIGKKKKI